MIVIDDRDAVALCGESHASRFHRDLISITVLERWATDHHFIQLPISVVIEKLQQLLDRDSLQTFFDQYGRYVGHVVLANQEPMQVGTLSCNLLVSTDIASWGYGHPNWLAHFEAQNGASLAIARRIQARLLSTISYLSRKNRTTPALRMRFGRTPTSTGYAASTEQVRYDVGEWLASGSIERKERFTILSLLAQSNDPQFVLGDAMALAYWAFALRQYRTGDDSTLLIWAWCNEEALAEMKASTRRVPLDVFWNCGPIPVLLCSIGIEANVRVAIENWRAALPKGAKSPYILDANYAVG